MTKAKKLGLAASAVSILAIGAAVVWNQPYARKIAQERAAIEELQRANQELRQELLTILPVEGLKKIFGPAAELAAAVNSPNTENIGDLLLSWIEDVKEHPANYGSAFGPAMAAAYAIAGPVVIMSKVTGISMEAGGIWLQVVYNKLTIARYENDIAFLTKKEKEITGERTLKLMKEADQTRKIAELVKKINDMFKIRAGHSLLLDIVNDNCPDPTVTSMARAAVWMDPQSGLDDLVRIPGINPDFVNAMRKQSELLHRALSEPDSKAMLMDVNEALTVDKYSQADRNSYIPIFGTLTGDTRQAGCNDQGGPAGSYWTGAIDFDQIVFERVYRGGGLLDGVCINTVPFELAYENGNLALKTISATTQLIPLGRGHYRFTIPNDYPDSVFTATIRKWALSGGDYSNCQPERYPLHVFGLMDCLSGHT